MLERWLTITCLIRSINVTSHGFNVFELENIDEDETYLAYKHQLVKAIDVPTLGQEASIATEPAVPAPAPLEHQHPAPLQPRPRFATLMWMLWPASGLLKHKWANQDGHQNLQKYVFIVYVGRYFRGNVFGERNQPAKHSCVKLADRIFSLTKCPGINSHAMEMKTRLSSNFARSCDAMAEIKTCLNVTHLTSSLYIYDVLIIHVWRSSIDGGQRKPQINHVLNFPGCAASVPPSGCMVHDTSELNAGTRRTRVNTKSLSPANSSSIPTQNLYDLSLFACV